MERTDELTDLLSELGLRIRSLRKDQRLTQEQLAGMLGMHRSCISRLESGRENVKLETLILLSNCLGVTPSELLLNIGVALASPASTDAKLIPFRHMET